MSEITAGATYTVRIDKHALSFKRGNDAVALVKGINGQREDYYYAPEHPEALRTGYVRNDDPATATSAYDPQTQTWTVTIPAAGGRALASLQTLADAYDAAVEPVTEDAPAPEPAAAPAKPARTVRRNGRGRDFYTEYADGFGPDERAAMPRRDQ